ncbi:MAG: ATP-binding domain-containing protein [Moraxellaceae bacterium]|nr:ATP-binding domain-containing protein [Moraxellaceae bacterium]
MTVHKSMSYKWQEVIFNVEKAGTTNENHFRWLYTGISRARKKVSLINYKPISPFDKIELIDCNNGSAANEFFYIAESKEIENCLTEFKDFVLSKLINIEIDRVESLNWQERYYLKAIQKQLLFHSATMVKENLSSLH